MTHSCHSAFPTKGYGGDEDGMTIREYFAIMALQGMLSGVGVNYINPANPMVAPTAVKYADMLIEELNKENK